MVHVMVGPGQSPATYEPTPRQMTALSKADLYFSIGVPFDSAWMPRIRKANPRMTIVDTTQGIDRRPMEAYSGHGHNHAHDGDHDSGTLDPHTWLDPDLVKVQARAICSALQKADWARAEYYEHNLATFLQDLDALDRDIRDILSGLENRKIMVFHPAWGYFADAYDLVQMPVEVEGKTPNAKTLQHLVEVARREGIRLVIVQKQFSKRAATVLAQECKATVVHLDPLSRDYISNLRHIAKTIASRGQG